MTGVLLCATGKVNVWNYDLMEQKAETDPLLLHQTARNTLEKGMVSTLTSQERNIHKLKAHQLTQLVDIFAPPYNKERAQNSTWFKVDDEPYQNRKNIYQATKR